MALYVIISSTSGFRKLIALVVFLVHTQLAPAERFSRSKSCLISLNEQRVIPREVSVMFSHVLWI